MKRVIGIAGIAGAGKDSFARVFEENGYTRLNFSDPLKKMCREIFNLSDFHLNNQEGKATIFPNPIIFTREHFEAIVNTIKDTHNTENFAKELSNIRREHVGKKLLYSPREIMQFVGTDICRMAHTDFHCQVFLKALEKLPEDESLVVTDCRFSNERKYLREYTDSSLFLIKRPGQSIIADKQHISETSLGSEEEYDYVIVNNGRLEDLEDKARNFL